MALYRTSAPSLRAASKALYLLPFLLWPALTGCMSFSSGVSAATSPGPSRLATSGPRIEAQIHTSSEGVLIGAEHSYGVPLTTSSCCVPWRAAGLVGYGIMPIVQGPRVGFELQGRIGIGRAPFARGEDDQPISLILGTRLAVPIRLSPTRAPWQSDAFATHFWAVVPQFDQNWFLATGIMPTAEFGGSLSLRVQFWSGVLP